MTAICGIVREGLDDYLSDALPSPQRRILRDHLAACPECREAAVARDGSLLFARRIADDVSAEESAGILASVRTGVAHIEAERRLSGRARRAHPAAAAAAAAALLALLVPAVRGRRETTTVASSVAARATVPTVVASAPSVLEPAAAPVETSAPSTATVYELSPGAGREEPRVVWIVDRGLDI